MDKKISIIGLGKLGSPMVAAYASRGYRVIGVDINADFVKAINEARAPVFEPKLQEYLAANKERISATQDYKEAVLNSDITFIIVPTPSKEEGDFSTKYAVDAAQKIGEAMKDKNYFHLVVLTSTVCPGATQGDLLPVLEEFSQKKCGKDFGLCYNPEFIALGNVIRDLLNPDFILIGQSDEKSGAILESFYKNICASTVPIKRMGIVNAEITKISLNTYVTSKISYANMLAELCEKIPEGNVDVVTDALGCDSRIGRKYLKGGLGYGGPCFPRDNKALVQTAKKFGASLPLAEATDQINQRQVPRLVERILALLPQNGRISILGLSYKPDTDVVEKSQAFEIAKILSEKNVPVKVYDPATSEKTKQALSRVEFARSLEEAVLAADMILISVPWPEFKNIEPGWLKKGAILFDCWRFLDASKYKDNVKYIGLGINYQTASF